MSARLYAATGDGFARLDEVDGEWHAERSLDGTGAQCLAAYPSDRDTVYVGLREGLWRALDASPTQPSWKQAYAA